MDRTPDTEMPEISMIMPCYNEEEVIGYTIPRLCKAFTQAGYRLQLVACDNGSSDRTGEIIRGFIEAGLPITAHRVEHNEGYGKGVLESIPICRAPWIGIIPADGQVDAEDVVRLYESAMVSNGRVVAKVRRRFRMDGPWRAFVSLGYNLFMWLLWPRLGSIDVNGSPKLLHRDVVQAMKLTSKDWLLDPEMMVKAQYMNVPVLEMNVFARKREHGVSHVMMETAWDFFVKLLGFRFGSALSSWRQEWEQTRSAAGYSESASAGR